MSAKRNQVTTPGYLGQLIKVYSGLVVEIDRDDLRVETKESKVLPALKVLCKHDLM